MIWHPNPGMRVRIRYRKSLRGYMPHHGKHGTVLAAGRGPGPINASIRNSL